MQENYIGMMCGTSLDSLDISLCSFSKTNRVKYFKSYPIKWNLKDAINNCKQRPINKKLRNETNEEVTKFIICSLSKFFAQSNIKNIKAIGFPGITIIHKPKRQVSVTLGDASKIAKHFGIKVISDFRYTDMKHGGQGAPLAPYFHAYISSNRDSFINIINLGGFANLTYLSSNKVMAFDTGPANYLIDAVTKLYFKKDFDKGGLLAKKGKINNGALMAMLSDRYFYQKPPKSTGFEKFNHEWLNKFIKKFNLNKSSLISTVTKLTSISISDAINNSYLDSMDIFFAGGGCKNSVIKNDILKRTGMCEVKELPWGLDYKNLESAAFAWLAMKRDIGQFIDKGYITGARRSRKLGVIYR